MLLPLYTLTLIQKYTCIILSLLLYIYIYTLVQTLICFYPWEPSHLEPLCIRYIYPQVYIYRMTDTFVYELKLCEITCVSALPVYTLKLFVYKHILTSVYIYIDILVHEPMLCKLTYVCAPCECSHNEPFCIHQHFQKCTYIIS